MGFVDSLLQMESTRVVSSVKSGICSMENGDVAPKFKRRRVSAVRDFPPGCGPLAVLILKQNEKFVAASKERSGDGCLEKINRVETKGEEPTVSSDQVNGHGLVKQESTGMLLPEAVCTLNDVSVVGSVEASVVGEAVKALEHETADASENLCKVDVAPAANLIQQNYPPRRRISAVRDFPPFCGPNAPLLNKEEAAKVLIFAQKKSLAQEKSGTEENPTKEMCIYVKDGDLNESRLESASRMDGDKVRIDPDSSVNNVKVAEENRHERCIKSPQEIILDQHDPNSMAVSKSVKMEVGGQEENLGKDLTVYMEDKSPKRKLSSRMDGDKARIDPDSSVNNVKVAEENRHERCIKSPQEIILDQHDPNSMAVSKSVKMEVGGQEENLGKDLTVYMEDKSPKRKLSSRMDGDKARIDPDSSVNNVKVAEENRHERCIKSPQEIILDQHDPNSMAVSKSVKMEVGGQEENLGKDLTVYMEDKSPKRKLSSRMDGDKARIDPDSSVNNVKVAEENRHERCIKSPQEIILDQHDPNSMAVSKSVKMEVGGQEENLGKDLTVYMEDKSPKRKLSSRMDGDKARIDPDSSVNNVKVAEENRHECCIKSPREIILDQHDLNSMAVSKSGKMEVGGQEENLGKDLTVYMEDKSPKKKLLDLSGGKTSMCKDKFEVLKLASGREIVQGLSAERNCPWRKGLMVHKHNMLAGDARESKGQKHNFTLLKRSKSSLKTKINELDKHEGIMKKNSPPTIKVVGGWGQMTVCNKEDNLENGGEWDDLRLVARSHNFDVSLPPSCPTISGKGNDNDAVTRNKVRETLRLFQAICRKLLHEEEAKFKERGNTRRRVDLQASKILKEKGKYVNTGERIFGSVPGVEVGDEFIYRVELNIVGLHRQIQGGIDYMKQDGKLFATSSGGNMMSGDKEPEDQKLERGNLALKNSMDAKNPVRVIRGDSKGNDSVDARGRTYIYDGLYLVEKCWQEIGSHGKLVFKFKLVRIQGQPELAWNVVKKSKKFKVREGVCVDDISQGKEKIPICAVNTLNDETPPPFKYSACMIYPHWCRRLPPKGCDCINGCSESRKCPCLEKNGGGIPYNYNGAIVEAKPLVYECGPSCKCPPSCYNRVSQHGIKFQLEIFKTESRGWGVRSLNSIPSGSFICEYAGELLEEKEAEERTGNDEYLFDIGNQFNDNSLWDGLTSLMPEAHSDAVVEVQNSGFTIDAAQFGSVGRFINHSCSPNLYAQNVLYDHDDKRIPHIMFFAVENIPPLQELTYHYNYMIDQVFDSNGNVKKKSCHCGSPECTGRMY